MWLRRNCLEARCKLDHNACSPVTTAYIGLSWRSSMTGSLVSELCAVCRPCLFHELTFNQSYETTTWRTLSQIRWPEPSGVAKLRLTPSPMASTYFILFIYIYIYIYTYIHVYIYIYICSRPPPPMIHTKLLFLSSGSWEVGSLGCENIGRDQISPKFLKPEMRKHRQGSNFPKIPKI